LNEQLSQYRDYECVERVRTHQPSDYLAAPPEFPMPRSKVRRGSVSFSVSGTEDLHDTSAIFAKFQDEAEDRKLAAATLSQRLAEVTLSLPERYWLCAAETGSGAFCSSRRPNRGAGREGDHWDSMVEELDLPEAAVTEIQESKEALLGAAERIRTYTQTQTALQQKIQAEIQGVQDRLTHRVLPALGYAKLPRFFEWLDKVGFQLSLL
jgi:hypothetical protein